MMKVTYLLVSLALIASCEKKENKIKSLPLDSTFRTAMGSEPPTLDWSIATDTSSSMIIDSVMDGLLAYDFSKGDIRYKPALAESVVALDKGKRWIFTMREGVYWSDGVPFSAQHIVDGWERLLNPKTGSAYSYFLFYVKNAKEYNSGKIKDFSKVGVRVIDNQKLEVVLTGPKHFFPFSTTHSSTFPIRKDIIKRYGSKWNRPENMVTLGPYLLDHWEHDKLIILKKNPDYYGYFPGNAKNIVIRIVAEPSTTLNLFDTNALDITGISLVMLPVLKKRPEYVATKELVTLYLGLNVKKYPLSNPKLRRAIAMSIDKSQIIHLMKGAGLLLNGWFPEGIFGYDPSIGLRFNPVKARKLLKEVARSPEDIPVIVLSFEQGETSKRIMENVQAQLKKNLGLRTEIATEEWKVYLSNLRLGESMIYRMGWLPDYPDPHSYMELMNSHSENNYSGWKSKKYDKLVEQASYMKNTPRRKLLYKKAQKILIEEGAAVIPILSLSGNKLLSKRILYYPDNIMSKVLFKEIKIRPSLKKVRK